MESEKHYGKKMTSSTLTRDQRLLFTCLLLRGINKSLVTYLDCLQQGLTVPSRVPQSQWSPEPSPHHIRLHKTHVGWRPLLLRKPNQESKVLQFMQHPVVTGSLGHLFKAKEQFLCLNV